MSKPITATALMMLVDEGKVNVDDPVEKYLPEFKGQMAGGRAGPTHVLLKKPKHPITVRQRAQPHQRPAVQVAAWSSRRSICCRLADAVRSYAMTPLEFEPDTKYQYSNAGINTAGRIIEVVSGMPYETFLDKRLFRPLGMKDTTFWPNKEQLAAAGQVVSAQRGQDGPRGDHRSTQLQVSARRPQRGSRCQPAACFRPPADLSLFCRMILGGRHVWRKTLPV